MGGGVVLSLLAAISSVILNIRGRRFIRIELEECCLCLSLILRFNLSLSRRKATVGILEIVVNPMILLAHTSYYISMLRKRANLLMV